MKFRIWLEDREKDFAFWQDLLPNYFGLDTNKGLGVSLDAMDRNDLIKKLQGLGEFNELEDEIQQQAIGLLQSANPGTLGDLIRTLSDSGMNIDTV